MIDPVTLTATLAGGLAKFAWDTIKEAPQEGLKGLAAGQAERITVAVLGEDRTRLAEDHVREFRRRLSGPRKLAQNHDIAKALRTAELEAIDHVILKFEESAGPNPPVQFLSEVRRRLYAAKAAAGRMTWDDNQQRAMLASFERSFTGSGAQLEGNLDGAARQATEIAWTELLSWSNSPAPDRLRSRFFGEHEGPTSWFEAYCGYVAEELKQPASRMREAFFAGKLVEIGGVVIEGSLVLKRIESGAGILQQELAAARGQLFALEEQGARIAADLKDLNRKTTPGPFRSMDLVLAQDEARLEASIFPGKDDYRNDRVHAPAVLEQVESALETQKSALVVGHGASGKTTLAKILACRPRFRNCAVYYLDLTTSSPEFPLGDRAVEAMARIADPEVLFVVDNAHLDPAAAFDIWQQWLTSGRGSRFLLLTRRIRAGREVWDASPEVEAMNLLRFELVVQPADLQGVYRRLTQTGAGASPLAPALLDRWQRLFGGDLMMFSVAVLGCVARGGDAETLRPEDAHAYIRSKYFEKLPDEKAALLDLAALAEFEVSAPVEAFERNAFEASIQRGLVWVDTRGRAGRYRHYRLCHPGLGALFRDAAGLLATSGQDRIRLLRAQPSAAAVLVTRLHRTGALEEARSLFQEVWRGSPWPWSAAELGLMRLKKALQLTQILTVMDGEELAKRAAAWADLRATQDELIRRALTTPSHFLASFLGYADLKVPAVARVIKDGLAARPDELRARALTAHLGDLQALLTYADAAPAPEVARIIREGLAANPAQVTARALATPPHSLVSFLRYAQRKMPGIAKVIWDGLGARPDEFAAQALTANLGGLGAFLVYADDAMPEVAVVIRASLAAHPDKLMAQALATPLEHLSTFLIYADGAMSEVADVIRAALKAHPEELMAQALATPLDHLGSFLTYAEPKMPEVATALLEALTAEPGVSQWAARFVLDGPEKIVALTQHTDAVIQVLGGVDGGAWRAAWAGSNHGQPSWFENFARLCYRAGRRDILGVTAGAIIRTARPNDLWGGSVTIKHLAAILVAPHDCTREEVDAFFARNIPHDWIGTQYRSRLAHPATLCSALRSVALDAREYLHGHFLHPDLMTRVMASQPGDHTAVSRIAVWLGLLAAASLLEDTDASLSPIDPALVRAALDEWPPGPPDEGVKPIQATLWAGLREWRRLGGGELELDSQLGEAILAQFRSAEPIEPPRWAALDRLMIDWLERCRENGWWVVAERTTLLQALRAQLG